MLLPTVAQHLAFSTQRWVFVMLRNNRKVLVESQRYKSQEMRREMLRHLFHHSINAELQLESKCVIA